MAVQHQRGRVPGRPRACPEGSDLDTTSLLFAGVTALLPFPLPAKSHCVQPLGAPFRLRDGMPSHPWILE